MLVTPFPIDLADHLPRPTLAPLRARLDLFGIVEHARGNEPTADFGHCTDDAGRALGLAVQLATDPDANFVAAACLRQLDRTLQADGRFVVRIDAHGHPTDDPQSDDSIARALWGLALASTDTRHAAQSRAASWILDRAAPFESNHPRAAAHAVLAGAALLASDPMSRLGRQLVDANFAHIPRLPSSSNWPWPEPRLTYGNALLAEASMAAGQLMADDEVLVDAIELLVWLIDHEWHSGGHFSFTPVAGRGPGDGTGFDQQPIEAWTLATACRRALDATRDPIWCDAIGWSAAWFTGMNDVGVPLWDPMTGAAFDGLTAAGPNLNQGTESTLAFIGTMHAYRDAMAATPAGARPSSASR